MKFLNVYFTQNGTPFAWEKTLPIDPSEITGWVERAGINEDEEYIDQFGRAYVLPEEQAKSILEKYFTAEQAEQIMCHDWRIQSNEGSSDVKIYVMEGKK